MNDIDILPEWYKSNRRRQLGYRVQYFALCCILVIMTIWGLCFKSKVSKAQAALVKLQNYQNGLEDDIQSFSEAKKLVAQMEGKAIILNEIAPRIDIPSVLAELSFLIDDNIILRKVKFNAENLANQPAGKTAASGLRAARNISSNRRGILLGDVRFTVMISGIAANASDVAELICKLEESEYFCQVIPFFSRTTKNGQLNALAGKTVKTTEFEIGCYLANYKEN